MARSTITFIDYETEDGRHFEVEVSFVPYKPASFHYPAEGEDFEVISAWNVTEKRPATDDEFDELERDSSRLKQKFFDKMSI